MPKDKIEYPSDWPEHWHVTTWNAGGKITWLVEDTNSSNWIVSGQPSAIIAVQKATEHLRQFRAKPA